MARYQVTAPDGSKFEITAPDGASQEEVMSYAREQFARLGAPTTQETALPTGAGLSGVRQQANLDLVAPPPTQQQPQQAAQMVGTGEDVARSLASGVVRGGMGLASLPGTVEWLGRKGLNMAGAGVSEDTALPTFGDIKQAYEGVAGPMYEPQTTAGQYARTVGEFAPGLMFPGGVAQRVVGNVVAPAVASETAGQMTAGTAAEPYARIAGGVAGAMLPGMASRAVSPISGGGAERQKMVQALENEGVTAITAGQRTGSKPLKWTESAIGDMPFTGGRASQIVEQQSEQFTRAALRRVGMDAPRATPDVIDAAFRQIGSEFDQIANQATVMVSPSMSMGMALTAAQYKRMVPQGMQVGLVDELAAAFKPGTVLRGPEALAWRSDIARAARSATDDNAAQALSKILDRLDSRIASSLTPEARQVWKEAKGKYRNLMAIERAATSAGENAAMGIISPSALRNAVKTLHGSRNYARGKGDFAELARAGEAILKPLPQSGTAPRAGAHTLMTLGGGVVGNAPGAIAAFAGPPLLGRAVMSSPVQRYLSNQTAVPMRQAVSPPRSIVSQAPAAAVSAPTGDEAATGNPLLDLYRN